jgi:hypothetical protein
MKKRTTKKDSSIADEETARIHASEDRPNAARGRGITKNQGYVIIVLLALMNAVVVYWAAGNAGTMRQNYYYAVPNTGWVRPDSIYGLVHVAKTCGSEINGELAMHYERVCGNKGYSFDALEANKRFKQSTIPNKSVSTDMGDSVSKVAPLVGWINQAFHRSRVPDPIMFERGFDDCDYIALESEPKAWKSIYEQWKMELHIPCRDPLSHLMSMCNFKQYEFQCSAKNISTEVEKCNVFLSRMSREFQNVRNVQLKCFNPIPPQPYLNYMGTILQRKRVEAEYIHRDSNLPRDKGKECIWKESQEFRDELLKTLRKEYFYYEFCGQCMGSNKELPL